MVLQNKLALELRFEKQRGVREGAFQTEYGINEGTKTEKHKVQGTGSNPE